MSLASIFRRFTRSSKAEGFTYGATENPRDLEHEFNSISMDKAGFNVFTTVMNYMAEPVLLGGNLSTIPTKINSLRREDARLRDGLNNYVLVTIYSSENNTNTDVKKRTTHTRKTEIRIPGKMLHQGSVFIDELDCYIMVESQIDATRKLIAQDVMTTGWDSISVPSSMIKQDPAKIYIEYKELVKFCVERQDKIAIRVGVDLQYGDIPDSIKTMHVSILDSYFVPYTCYKLVYDPTLHPDEFVIENLHIASREEFRSTFSDLKEQRAMYLDQNQAKTLFGDFYGMALFVNEERYLDYVHERKSQERFSEETLFLANRSGDPRLKEEITKLSRELSVAHEKTNDQEAQLHSFRTDTKNLKAMIKDREETIERIRKNHDAAMSADTVQAEIENDRKRLENENLKIRNERVDQEHREKAAPFAHKAAILKTISDIMKSGWGIATACMGGILTIIALCKKYNVKLTMGA